MGAQHGHYHSSRGLGAVALIVLVDFVRVGCCDEILVCPVTVRA